MGPENPKSGKQIHHFSEEPSLSRSPPSITSITQNESQRPGAKKHRTRSTGGISTLEKEKGEEKNLSPMTGVSGRCLL